MIILGIDPAMSGPAGAAVLDTAAPLVVRLDVLAYGRREPAEARYQSYSAWLAALWSRWGGQIDLCAVEDNYLKDNVSTVKALAQCVGIARAHAYARGAPFALVNPTHTRPTLVTLGPLLLGARAEDIPASRLEHAHCAAAIAWRAWHERQAAALEVL